MPILWKVLLKKFFFAFSLGLAVFIFLSLVGNIQSVLVIAKFGPAYQSVFLIYLSNLLEMSGMCLGFCSLLGSFYATSQLSLSGQMIFLLPLGIRSKEIQKPLLHVSLLFSFISFLCISEILPYVKTRLLSSHKENLISPLTLLSDYKLSGFYESFVDMDLHENGKTADNFLLIQNNSYLNGLLLFKAERVSVSGEGLLAATHANFICHPPMPNAAPSLFIENADTASLHLCEFMSVFSSTPNTLHNSTQIPLSMLLNTNPQSAGIEIMRRISLALFPFTFTLIGASLGQRSKLISTRGSIAFLLAVFFLCCIALQSTNTTSPLYWKILLYTLPHAFLWYLAKIHRTLFENPSLLS